MIENITDFKRSKILKQTECSDRQKRKLEILSQFIINTTRTQVVLLYYNQWTLSEHGQIEYSDILNNELN